MLTSPRFLYWAIPSVTVIGNPHPADPRGRLAWEIETVADRLRNLSQARLTAPFPPYASRAAAGRHLAQELVDAALSVAVAAGGGVPVVRTIPETSAFAVGEQVAVTGHDLIDELATVPDDSEILHGGERVRVGAVVAASIATLKELRLAL